MADLTTVLNGLVRHKIFLSQSALQTAITEGKVANTDVVFVKDTGAIWTHGAFFGEGSSVLEGLDAHVGNLDNPHKVTASQVGLGNVDNTADIDKPVSTAQQAALDKKVDKVTGKSLVSDSEITKLAGLKSQTEITADITAAQENAAAALKVHTDRIDNPHNVTAYQVGLGNVLNVAQIPASEKGAAGGVATLDTDGKVPAAQLPSYVDDVIEYASLSALEKVSGESGKIYVTLDDNKTYRWSGSAYVEISASLAIGETASTAFSGARGVALENSVSGVKSDLATLEGVVANKVDKKDGYGLSKNDFTDTLKTKLDNIASGAQVNVIEKVTINGGEALGISDKTVDITIPTKLTELTNDGNFVKDGSYVHTDNNYTTEEKTKLAGVEAGAQVNVIESIKLNGTAVTISAKAADIQVSKGTVGLGNVDNTSDAAKPISTAQAEKFNEIIGVVNNVIEYLTWTEG